MATVKSAKRTRFHDSFYTEADNIYKGPSTIQAAAPNGNWEKWDEFFRDVALGILLVLYRYPVPILNEFI